MHVCMHTENYCAYTCLHVLGKPEVPISKRSNFWWATIEISLNSKEAKAPQIVRTSPKMVCQSIYTYIYIHIFNYALKNPYCMMTLWENINFNFAHLRWCWAPPKGCNPLRRVTLPRHRIRHRTVSGGETRIRRHRRQPRRNRDPVGGGGRLVQGTKVFM